MTTGFGYPRGGGAVRFPVGAETGLAEEEAGPSVEGVGVGVATSATGFVPVKYLAANDGPSTISEKFPTILAVVL